MSEPAAEPAEPPEEAPAPRRSRRRRILAVIALVLAVAVAGLWFSRVQIANRIIAGQLEDLGLPAKYDVERIGTQHQALRNIVIGDPAHPDLTVERVVIDIEARLGVPTLDKVTLQGARLYGTYKGGKLSFGALDKVIFAKRAGPSGLPDLDLILVDGRARIDSDYGVIGAKAEGSGNLRSGFAGTLAAIAPKFAVADCKGERVSLYGKVTTASAQPSFSGPVRLTRIECPKTRLALRDTTVGLELTLGEAFDTARGRYTLAGGALNYQGYRVTGSKGKGDFSLAKGDLVASHDITGKGVDLGGAGAGTLTLDGSLRSRDHMAAFDGEGRVRGTALKGGAALVGTLAGLEQSGEGTLLAPLARQLRTALQREERGSSLRADYSLRQTGGITRITLPSAEIRGGSGSRLVGLSRFSLALGLRGGPRFSGNFATSGAGIPRMQGTAQRNGSGGIDARFSLAEYRAGNSAVALPDLRLVQLPSGEIGFSGHARINGPLPGGEVRELALPVRGNWSQARGLAVWRECTQVSFDRLKIGNLAVANRGMTLCPGSEGAIVRSDGRGTRFAAGSAGLDLAGTLGTTPIRLKSSAVGFAYPGKFVARAIDVTMGAADKPSTLKLEQFEGLLGKVVTGHFRGAELKLFPVPLDISEGEGDLRFANNDLAIDHAALRVTDREKEARFEPLIARDATLRLHSTTFTADALLREPASDREVVAAHIVHDLDTASGFADLKVPGILFDDKLQPTKLTYFAQGVVALAKGTVTGDGRIDWDENKLTSTGSFTTQGLDFAAAFGPVKGVTGTVVFSDLLGLVTAPDQRLKLASINPGIEVFDGEVSFQLEPDRVLFVNGAKWPFMDGSLELLPTKMVLGASEVRRYTLKVDGANAAKFVSQLELANISASGTFDGALPLVFDQDGGRIENGLLISRPPGGNLSYVGELTYKDLSAMGNFAFQTLRSLDFRRMEIGLNGQIDGDIVTTLRIEGVRQGSGAKRNFITRQLAGLPIQFNININAPFYQLVTSFKGLYDPAYVRDPRSLGLIDAQGKPRDPAAPKPGEPPAPLPPATVPPQKNDDIQHPDSRNSP